MRHALHITRIILGRKKTGKSTQNRASTDYMYLVNGVMIESERNLKYAVSLKEQLELSLCSDKYKDVVIVKLSVCQN